MLLLAIVSFGIPLALALQDRVDSEVRRQALSAASLIAANATDQDDARLQEIADQASRSTRGRVTIVDANGLVVADSADDGAAIGESYASRPEFRRALERGTYQERRRSDTLDQEILATAVPIIQEDEVQGAVRVTQSVEAVNDSVHESWIGLVLIAVVVMLVGLAAGVAIARRLTAPVRDLEATAGVIAAGDLEQRATVAGTTEQQSLARSFNEMTGRLAEALSSQREFVADASHQLRTPLAGLRLRIEEAQAAGVSADSEHELRAALREVDRLSETVDELLVLSRAGDRDNTGEWVDLCAAARSAAARFTPAADERGVAIEVEADGRADVWTAPADLQRALDAAIENALAYGRDGGSITLEARPGWIAVKDRGPGFEAGEHEQVFQRFHRGSAGRAGPRGSGLGLPIARALMERWGGTARATDRDGGGAVIVIELPTTEPKGFTESLPKAGGDLPSRA